jgi:ACS family glucarate transporter-like MFS transporter
MEQSRNRMSRQRFVLISILFFHSVNTYMDRVCISTAVDHIKEDLGITATMMGLILGVFAFGYALFQIPSGWIADHFGPRKALTIVVSVWSCFTALTGAAVNAVQMLVLRFLFGMGEAGAFPGATQAFFRWLPPKERGLAHGINFSGSRLGAAFSFILMPILISGYAFSYDFFGLLDKPFTWNFGGIGWRWTFVVNGIIGIIWAAVWLAWFKDNPEDNKKVNTAELDYINKGCLVEQKEIVKASFAEVFTSLNMSLAMLQYFASNVTFYLTISWLPSYIKNTWANNPNAKFYAAIPLVFAAFANWTAGGMVTRLYKKGYHVGSRRLTAIVGFVMGAFGLLMVMQTDNLRFLTTDMSRLYWFIGWFSAATFGVDMTLSPSWSFCNDIGGGNSGAVSGSMNMVGNIGAALGIILFPIMKEVYGSANPFFAMAAGLNVVAVIAWCFMNPKRHSDKQLSPEVIRNRFIVMLSTLFALTLGVISLGTYRNYKQNKAKEKEESKQVVPEVQNDILSPDSPGDSN